MKKIKLLVTSLLLGTMAFSVVGCGSNKEKVEEPPKDKGKVVVYSAGPESLTKKLVDDFKSKTGITVETFDATTGKILSRLEAEKDNPAADVVIVASLSSAEGLKKSGQTMQYNEAKNANKLYDGWKDKENNYFGYSGSALGIVYNTNLVKIPPSDWSDLTKEEFNGMINIPDPSLSGSCADFVSGYLNINGESGLDYFKALKTNGTTMVGANKEALDPVITGAKSIVAAGVDYMTLTAKAKGEPVDIVYPSSGTVINPRPALILKESKNVDNAKAFIDYLLSDDAQKIVASENLLPGNVNAKGPNGTSVKDIKALKVDWNWMADNSKENNKKFTEIFK
ncbi:MAG: extracellular solute-binding protein [Clostridium sp.]